jgi:hypothetical protein
MLEPSGTSFSDLIPIFCLLNQLLYLGMFSDGERGKRIVYNAMRILAPTRSEALKSQSYNFFSLRLALGQLAQQGIWHMDFYRSHWENLLQGNSKSKGDAGQAFREKSTTGMTGA